ncbi:ribonuclease H-like domain-containing protein [Mycena belliarum]|uniref:RNA exonuclease 4 n=1 Tax=Mycena belliarum TaxID=1033014 RepID=A0AAD6U1Z6_9AGAR|nr:ribonuclease H-like domain-containing protein [Mycena belliae]
MTKKISTKPTLIPSGNWLALQKVVLHLPYNFKHLHVSFQVLPKPARKQDSQDFPRKRRKIDSRSPSPAPQQLQPQLQSVPLATKGSDAELKNGESLSALRNMIFGKVDYTDAQRQPGKFLALDCEMVGVGPEGAESSLARVSLVNYHGAIQLDAFVRQRERVVDYRTQFSGVRESDMVHARPFEEVQKQIAALLKDRVLVGHAVFNDLKVLFLSHPRPQTRDTQHYAGKYKLVKSKRIALRHLVQQELGVAIQGGEHSSVTDARATMAVYRIHRKEWEKGSAPLRLPTAGKGKKRARDDESHDSDDSADEAAPAAGKGSKSKAASTSFPGGGRKGVSSGLSTVVRRAAPSTEKKPWWKDLGDAPGSKFRLSAS